MQRRTFDHAGRTAPLPGWLTRLRAGDAAKRAFDVALAAALLVALLPLLVLLAAAVRLESRGPVLFRCPRVGAGGLTFAMLKFRKMRDGAAGPPLTAPDDARFTRLGGLLARTRLDEVPQLLNVLRGDMSLVGPRPEDPRFVEAEREAFETVLRVRPGITGLSQLAYAREPEILDAHDPVRDYRERILPGKLDLDRLYVARRSLRLDATVLLWTLVATVGRREVSVSRATGRISRRHPRREPRPSTDHDPAGG